MLDPYARSRSLIFAFACLVIAGVMAGPTAYAQIISGGSMSPMAMTSGAALPNQKLLVGNDVFAAGTKTVVFAEPFTTTPQCICSGTTGVANVCARGAVSLTGATFVGVLTDTFSYFCVGGR